MHADDYQLRKGLEFEDELGDILMLSGIDARHHNNAEKEQQFHNKYDVDYLVPSINIGIDAKWSGSPLYINSKREINGIEYGRNNVLQFGIDNMQRNFDQKAKFQLNEIYFVLKADFDNGIRYWVISLSRLHELYTKNEPGRVLRSNGREVTIKVLTHEAMNLDEFLDLMKGVLPNVKH